MRLFLSILLVVCIIRSSATEMFSTEKILQVSVDEIGTVSVGRDTVGADNLARYIQERLFKSYLGTGQMQGKIKIVRSEERRVGKECRSRWQRKALTQVCLQKYKNLFERIDAKKQAKLKKQFPVLFQTEYL